MELVKATEDPVLNTISKNQDTRLSPDPVPNEGFSTMSSPTPGSSTYAVGSWIVLEHQGTEAHQGHYIEGRGAGHEEASKLTAMNGSGR